MKDQIATEMVAEVEAETVAEAASWGSCRSSCKGSNRTGGGGSGAVGSIGRGVVRLQRQQMDDEQLQLWVQRISLEFFGRPFRHKASFNSRLRTTGGRYFIHSHHIEISRSHWELFGEGETEGIIKHELCHYHLHLTGGGYRHRDADFKNLLKQVGGARYCKTGEAASRKRRSQPYRYRYVCSSCSREYLRKRRMDITRYVCGVCRGRLMVEPVSGGRLG